MIISRGANLCRCLKNGAPLGPAIAAGNAFILKPSERDPGVPMRLAELMIEAGLPEGVLNVVQGDKDVVEAIRESVDVDRLRVDGGVTNEPLMLELQADAIGAPVEAAGADATVLGAAALAAVGSGTNRNCEGARAVSLRRTSSMKP